LYQTFYLPKLFRHY